MVSTVINFIFNNRKSRKIKPEPIHLAITELSQEIRLKIWAKLSIKDQKAIRRVCKAFQEDIDESIGIHGILKKGSLPNLCWIQNTRLKSLLIENLLQPQVSHYLKSPYLLQKLTIVNSIMSVPNLRTLLKELSNLRELSLLNIPGISESFPDMQSFRSSGHVLLAWNELPIFLSTLASNPKLATLHLDFNTANCEVVAQRQMEEDEFRTIDWREAQGSSYAARLKHLSINICDKLGYGYNMALERNDNSLISSALREWGKFLSVQDRLETLVSSLGILNWTYYKPVLLSCSSTLSRIELFNISSPAAGNLKTVEIFDWAFFKSFTNLKSFRLTARSDYDFDFLPTINFTQLPFRQLNFLELIGVELEEDDLYHALYHTRSQLKNLKLERNFMFRMHTLFVELLRTVQHEQFESVTIRQAFHLYEYQNMSLAKIRNLCSRYGYSLKLHKELGEGVLEVKRQDPGSGQRRLMRSKSQKLLKGTGFSKD